MENLKSYTSIANDYGGFFEAETAPTPVSNRLLNCTSLHELLRPAYLPPLFARTCSRLVCLEKPYYFLHLPKIRFMRMRYYRRARLV